MTIESIKQKIKKETYIIGANLAITMEKYEENQTVNNLSKLEVMATLSREVLLPSGRMGNSIALALELNKYICAKHLIDRSKELNLKLDVISKSPEGDKYTLKDEFELSLMTFSEEELQAKVNYLIRKKPYAEEIYQRYYEDTISSKDELAKKIIETDKII